MMSCSKCGARSGDDWTQCNGACPMPGSPHFEASGSERERLISVMRDHIELGETGSCSAEIVGHEEAADAILALRPQPSGETREVADADCLALLSARPLALEGQQGEAFNAGFEAAKLAEGLSEEARLQIKDAALGEYHPARAEAQDEGAAGERERIARIIDPDQWALQDFGASKNGGERLPGWEVFLNPSLNLADRILAAHSSPTPAADAERMRIMREGWAAEMFDAGHTVCEDRWTDRHVTEERRDRYRRAVDRKVNEALAALKSEGK